MLLFLLAILCLILEYQFDTRNVEFSAGRTKASTDHTKFHPSKINCTNCPTNSLKQFVSLRKPPYCQACAQLETLELHAGGYPPSRKLSVASSSFSIASTKLALPVLNLKLAALGSILPVLSFVFPVFHLILPLLNCALPMYI